MSSLANLPINTTYPSLLKLETSTSGITSSIQNVQDGDGTNTGMKIATNRFEGGNLMNYYRPAVPKFLGNGIGGSTGTPNAGVQNQLMANMFYDTGLNSYSAFTVYCATLEAGSSVDIAFYNSQYIENYGYVPYQKLDTEINISTTSTGLKVGTFSSPISFSGTGAGIYWCIWRFNTAGTPVVRLSTAASNVATYMNGFFTANMGYVPTTGNPNIIGLPYQSGVNSTLSNGPCYTNATFPSTWTSTELSTISNQTSVLLGFLLHTIR